MTPDQMNVEALLASQDYLQTTMTDLTSTADLRNLAASLDLHALSEASETGGMVGGRTMGSTSEMSLPAGMTQTLEREESEIMSRGVDSVDTESDMRHSAKYPDSLEGTGALASHISNVIDFAVF